jgi:small subunit ribosomal protein S9
MEKKIQGNKSINKTLCDTTFVGIGRRKTSVACVKLHPLSENYTRNTSSDSSSEVPTSRILVNCQRGEDYFQTNLVYLQNIIAPLKVSKLEDKFKIVANTRGGGLRGQSDAIKLGVSRALEHYSPNIRKLLKPYGFFTRDPRHKERKKYGLKKARKSPQFSKR